MTIKETIFEIDSIARDYNHYEYGLPTHTNHFNNLMEEEIRKLIEFHVTEALKQAEQRCMTQADNILEAYPLSNIK